VLDPGRTCAELYKERSWMALPGLLIAFLSMSQGLRKTTHSHWGPNQTRPGLEQSHHSEHHTVSPIKWGLCRTLFTNSVRNVFTVCVEEVTGSMSFLWALRVLLLLQTACIVWWSAYVDVCPLLCLEREESSVHVLFTHRAGGLWQALIRL
jgi:hypothetical protein